MHVQFPDIVECALKFIIKDTFGAYERKSVTIATGPGGNLKGKKNHNKFTSCVMSRFQRTRNKYRYCTLANDSFTEKHNTSIHTIR